MIRSLLVSLSILLAIILGFVCGQPDWRLAHAVTFIVLVFLVGACGAAACVCKED